MLSDFTSGSILAFFSILFYVIRIFLRKNILFLTVYKISTFIPLVYIMVMIIINFFKILNHVIPSSELVTPLLGKEGCLPLWIQLFMVIFTIRLY